MHAPFQLRHFTYMRNFTQIENSACMLTLLYETYRAVMFILKMGLSLEKLFLVLQQRPCIKDCITKKTYGFNWVQFHSIS